MKKYIIQLIILLIFSLFGCEQLKPITPEKPFIIYYKSPNSYSCQDDFCYYYYYDKNKNSFGFCDDKKMYNIGDTIK